VGCYIWYSDEGTGRGPSPPGPLLAVPNITAHPSTASVPITVLLYNSMLLCSFNVGIKGLKVELLKIVAGYSHLICYSLIREFTIQINHQQLFLVCKSSEGWSGMLLIGQSFVWYICTIDLLLLICVSRTISGQPRNSVFICRV